MTTIRRNLKIKLLGYIWMPSCLAVQDRRIELGSSAFAIDIEPNVAAVEAWIGSNSGDFQSIKDWYCELITTDIVSETDKVVRTTVIKDWDDEENEDLYWHHKGGYDE